MSPPPIDIARVEYYLDEWAYFMGGTGGGGGARGYGSASAGFVNTRSSSSLEEMQSDAEKAICAAIDTIVYRELPLHESAAIQMAYRVSAVWRFKRLDMEAVLVQAKVHVGEALIRKGFPV